MAVADLLVPSRRSFLAGLGAALCAPAIVRASSLMPVKAPGVSLRTIVSYDVTDQPISRLDVLYGSLNVRPEWTAYEVLVKNRLAMNRIVREAFKLFAQSNVLLQNLTSQYDDARIGSSLRIRLPNDYHVRD